MTSFMSRLFRAPRPPILGEAKGAGLSLAACRATTEFRERRSRRVGAVTAYHSSDRYMHRPAESAAATVRFLLRFTRSARRVTKSARDDRGRLALPATISIRVRRRRGDPMGRSLSPTQ